jgi:hypothetical protein
MDVMRRRRASHAANGEWPQMVGTALAGLDERQDTCASNETRKPRQQHYPWFAAGALRVLRVFFESRGLSQRFGLKTPFYPAMLADGLRQSPAIRGS